MREFRIAKSLTERNTVIDSYFNDVSRMAPVGPEQEAVLAQRIRQGDQAALNQLVQANLRFVISVAKKYRHMGLPLADLISEGNLGLIEAARRFDETRGFKFISLAVWWIRQRILLAVAEQAQLIRLPGNQVNMLTKVNKTTDLLAGALERLPTDEELAELSGIAPEKIADSRYFAGRTLSYDAPIGTEPEFTLLDRLAATGDNLNEMVEREAGQALVSRLFTLLAPAERLVLECCYGLGGKEVVPTPEIAAMLCMCESSVHVIRKRALKKLKAGIRP